MNESKSETRNESKSVSIDPICGMTVNNATAIHVERDGETFYFCGDKCRQKFLAAPSGVEPAAKSGCCCK